MALAPWTCVCGARNAGPAPCSRCLTPAPASVIAEPVIVAPGRPLQSRMVLPLAVVIAVLLLAGAIAVGAVEDGAPTAARPGGEGGGSADLPPGGQTIAVTPEGAPPGLTGSAAEIGTAIPELMRFVERERGLPFKEPVEVTLLGDDAFRASLSEAQSQDESEVAEARERIRDHERVLRALGLLEGDVDLEKARAELQGDAVAGYYNSRENNLVVRGDELTPAVRVTFVHELTHALQDQHFELFRPEIDDRDDEASYGFLSLVEGDAVAIQERYLDSLPQDVQKQAEREEMEAAAGISPDLPRILLELLYFPYLAGPPFVRSLVDAGGQEALDAAFASPPITTEQVLHPEAYVEDGEPPREVVRPRPPGGRDAIDQGVLGEYGLILILQRLIDQRTAVVASRGWGGDRYVAWRDGDATCVKTNLVMDTATDAAELTRALRAAAGERDRFDVTSTPERISFVACG